MAQENWEALELAKKHWEWIDGLISPLMDDKIDYVIVKAITEYLYKTAFIHGWKHGKQ